MKQMDSVGFVGVMELLGAIVTDLRNKHKHRHRYINQCLSNGIE